MDPLPSKIRRADFPIVRGILSEQRRVRVLPSPMHAIPVIFNPGTGTHTAFTSTTVDCRVDRIAVVAVNIFLADPARPHRVRQRILSCTHGPGYHPPVLVVSIRIVGHGNQGNDRTSFSVPFALGV